MPSPSLTIVSEPSAVQLESQLDALDSAFDALSASTTASLAAFSTDLGEFEDRIEVAEGDVTTLQSDVSTLQSQNPYLNTNVLIQAALTANAGVTQVEKIPFLASDVDDPISLTVDKTVYFLACTNVAFLFTWDDSTSVLRPTVSFEACTLNSTKTDFLSLLDIENSTGEVQLTVKNCKASDGSALPDMSYLIIGGLS